LALAIENHCVLGAPATPDQLLILISICGSTTLIALLKKIMSVYGFGLRSFLTIYHFLLTSAVLTRIAQMKFFVLSSAVARSHRLCTLRCGQQDRSPLKSSIQWANRIVVEMQRVANVMFVIVCGVDCDKASLIGNQCPTHPN
jgi:hypothetical protein